MTRNTVCLNSSCGHPRRTHSRNGCNDFADLKTGKPCSCKIPYMEVGKRSR